MVVFISGAENWKACNFLITSDPAESLITINNYIRDKFHIYKIVGSEVVKDAKIPYSKMEFNCTSMRLNSEEMDKLTKDRECNVTLTYFTGGTIMLLITYSDLQYVYQGKKLTDYKKE